MMIMVVHTLCVQQQVLNVAFEKTVTVRVTTDDWKTFRDIPAQFSCSESSSDRFHVRV